MADLGKYQNGVDELKDLEVYRYENIFYYNILKKIKIPDDLNERLFDTVNYNDSLPWTTLSFRIYGTTYLWWTLMIFNKISDPFSCESGKKIRFIKKEFLKPVLDSITQQLQ